MKINYTCPNCKAKITRDHPDVIHAGFDDSGFLYCDKSGDLLFWSAFDPTYKKIVDGVLPWTLSDEQKKKVESALKECDCGGKFLFSAPPRCPNCNSPVPKITGDNIHMVRLKREIDGSKRNIWK